MKQEIINLYDEYTHKPLSRNEFLKKLSVLTGGMTAALTILPALESNYALAQTSAADLFTEYVTYPTGDGQMKAGLSRLPSCHPSKRLVFSETHSSKAVCAYIRRTDQ